MFAAEIGQALPGSDAEKRLLAIWETAPGWRGWLSTVDHKTIGLRYLVAAFVFLLLGGVEALILRLQLARPNATLLTPEQYNQLFTMHGITMIFLYALPVLSGFSNYLWPLLLGSRDMAFPRLNALSFWVFLFAGIFLYASFPLGEAPNDGWFNYVPFSGPVYNTGPNIDVYALGMVLLGISTTAGAVNFVITLFRLRAPGMSINRMPILVWGTLTASVANLLAVPSVSLAFFLLWLDRQMGMHFFDTSDGGKALLWQHLFWIFGHPWVYVIVLPAMGIVSDGLPVFCRRPLVGYAAVALSTVATMLIGFEVWVHHMFATGLPSLALSFFGAASMVISIPSAVATFAWIATIWLGRPVFKTPFLFFAGFVLLFVIGGVSGVMTAAVPLDLQLNNTYFIVAHLHYVLLGINVFPVVGGIYYWFPKFTGRLMDERLGKWSFWVMFIGFNLGFFPMHIAGLMGMPRQIYTYAPDMGWNTVNMLSSVGSFIFAFGILVFLVNVFISLRRGAPAGENPWDAPTLEWATPSPPPPYNFAVIPQIASRHPLWEDRIPESKVRSNLTEGYLLAEGRETIGTTPIDAAPQAVFKMPENSYAPFCVALFCALMFVGFLLQTWDYAALAALLTVASIIAWVWPLKLRTAETGQPNAWWGMWALIVTEGSLFGYLLFSYFYLDAQADQRWPPEGLPELSMPVLGTILLLSSSVFVWLCERCVRQNRIRRSLGSMIIAIILGVAFVAVQLKEWSKKTYGPASNIYGSLYFTITGFHMLHVVIGLIILSLMMLWIGLGYLDERRNKILSIGGLYWHFVDAVWLFIFSSFFWSHICIGVRHEQDTASLHSNRRCTGGVGLPDVAQRTAGRRCLLSPPHAACRAKMGRTDAFADGNQSCMYCSRCLVGTRSLALMATGMAGTISAVSGVPGRDVEFYFYHRHIVNSLCQSTGVTMSSMGLKRFTLILFLLCLLWAAPALADDAAVSRGAYLAKVADCAACHTVAGHPAFAGGLPINSPLGTIYSVNITPDPDDGIGRYSLKDFDRAVRKGIAKDGTRLYPAMTYTSYAAASDQDISDLYAYFMKGVAPVHISPPQTKLTFPFNQRWGIALWDLVFAAPDHYEVKKDRSAAWNRGAYIVQTLGHCGACHTPRNLAYAEKGYTESTPDFLSGAVIDNWFAPDLRKLNHWPEDDIVSFLKTGHGFGNAAFGSMTQVVEDSTQYMREDDLKAVASYLKSLPEKETIPSTTVSSAQWPGAGLYHSACASCHKASGSGEDSRYPRLVGSTTVLSADSTSLIRLVLQGGKTAQTAGGLKPETMPAFEKKLTDREIADVLSYIRNSWGNRASPVSAHEVSVLRKTLNH